MTRSALKVRNGGVLVREYRRKVLDGDPLAMRAMIRQACGPNTLTLPIGGATGATIRMAPNGTGGDRLVFDGMFTSLDAGYQMWDWAGDYTEIVNSGALDKTTAESPDVKFVLNHDWLAAPMARTTAGSLDVNPDGTCIARMDGSRADVHILASAVEGGELNAMSFAFWVMRQTWSPDYLQRDILELDIDGGDVSVVTHPANPGTTGSTTMRAAARAGLLRSGLVPLLQERQAAELRAGKALSASTMETLQAVLDLIGQADEAVDAAQPLLAELMGVPNPDADDPDNEDDVEEDSAPAGDPEAVSATTHPDLIRERMRLAERARART